MAEEQTLVVSEARGTLASYSVELAARSCLPRARTMRQSARAALHLGTASGSRKAAHHPTLVMTVEDQASRTRLEAISEGLGAWGTVDGVLRSQRLE